MKRLLVLFCCFCLGAIRSAAAIDREAFTITRYQLEVQVDRTSHVMAVTGKLTLRNDSKTPQKVAGAAGSSSLEWNSITLDDKPLQWLSDDYTSDIDHTGSLSEAIVTLPKELRAGASVTLDVQYGGTITPDATRLTRMGAPEEVAARNDWDQISDAFHRGARTGLCRVVSGGDRSGEHERWQRRVRCDRGLEASPRAQRIRRAHHRCSGGESESLCVAVNAAVTSCGEARETADPQSGGKLKEFSNTLDAARAGRHSSDFRYRQLSGAGSAHRLATASSRSHFAGARLCAAAEANDPLLHDWLGEPDSRRASSS